MTGTAPTVKPPAPAPARTPTPVTTPAPGPGRGRMGAVEIRDPMKNLRNDKDEHQCATHPAPDRARRPRRRGAGGRVPAGGQAGPRWRGVPGRPAAPGPLAPAARGPDPPRLVGAGLLPPGAPGARRPGVPDLEVPHDG